MMSIWSWIYSKTAEEPVNEINRRLKQLDELDTLREKLNICISKTAAIDMLQLTVSNLEKEMQRFNSAQVTVDVGVSDGEMAEIKKGFASIAMQLRDCLNTSDVTEKKFNAQIVQINNNLNELSRRYSRLEEAQKTSELLVLQKRLDKSEENCRELAKHVLNQDTEIKNLRQLINNSKTDNLTDSKKEKFGADTSGKNTEEKTLDSVISKFVLKRNQNKIMIHNSDREVVIQDFINKTKDVSELITFLSENESYESFANHLKIVGRYKEQLTKVFSNFTLDDVRDSEISEIVSLKFFDILSKYFINRIIGSIYKRVCSNDRLFIMYLKLVNKYLDKVGIYTYDLAETGSVLTEKNMEYFECTVMSVSDKSKDNVIKEIEQLPYEMLYENQFNEVSERYTEGILKIYSIN